jgi:hypothetical protein
MRPPLSSPFVLGPERRHGKYGVVAIILTPIAFALGLAIGSTHSKSPAPYTPQYSQEQYQAIGKLAEQLNAPQNPPPNESNIPR